MMIENMFLTVMLFFIILPFTILVVLESILQIKKSIGKLFIEEISRKDILPAGYRKYIEHIDNWSKPMFKYIPIGLRVFNNDNPLPGLVTNNSLGFRSPEFTDTNNNEIRVVVLGGSAAWGCGASSNDHTIAGYLECILQKDKKLNEHGKKVRVFNLAQINGTQTQDLLHTVLYVSKIKPEYVISFTGWNELVTMGNRSDESLLKYRVFNIDEMDLWAPLKAGGESFKKLKESLYIWGSRYSEVIKLMKFLLPNEQKITRTLEEKISIGSDLFLENLENIVNLSNAYGFTHYQFMQPYLYRKEDLSNEEKSIINLYDKVRPVHGGDEIGNYLRNNNIYEDILMVMHDNKKTYGSVTDLCDLFRKEKKFRHYTLVHFNDDGYNDIANAISAVMIDRSLST